MKGGTIDATKNTILLDKQLDRDNLVYLAGNKVNYYSQS